MNGKIWYVIFVDKSDSALIDRTSQRRLGTTNLKQQTVYLSNALDDSMRKRVLLHELAHCTMASYGLLDDIHRMTKQRYWVDAEEWICNFLANYSSKLLGIANDILREA